MHYGSILTNTKNEKQAAKIFQLTTYKNGCLVKVRLHKSVNFSTGVVYTNKIREMPEDEILELLKPKAVSEANKKLR